MGPTRSLGPEARQAADRRRLGVGASCGLPAAPSTGIAGPPAAETERHNPSSLRLPLHGRRSAALDEPAFSMAGSTSSATIRPAPRAPTPSRHAWRHGKQSRVDGSHAEGKPIWLPGNRLPLPIRAAVKPERRRRSDRPRSTPRPVWACGSPRRVRCARRSSCARRRPVCGAGPSR